MMKVFCRASLIAVVCGALMTVGSHADDKDLMSAMKNCTVCRTLTEHPVLMQEMAWESHKIDNGMLCLSTVTKERLGEFKEVHKQMMQSVENLKKDSQSGKDQQLCSFCKKMSELEKAGAKQKIIETKLGAVSLLTSDNPEVVKKIHAVAEQAIAEQKKMNKGSDR